MPSIPNPRLRASINTLADLKLPKDTHISPDGSKLVYALEPFSKSEKYPVSSLWIAEIGKDHSARQITSGLFHDDKSKCIGAFGEAYPLAEGVKGVKEFEWSGDGIFIAFVSADGDGEGEGAGEGAGEDDSLIFGGEDYESNHQRLSIFDVDRGTVRTLTPPEEDVDLFLWSQASPEVAYTVSSPGSKSQFGSTQLNIVSADSGSSRRFITTKGPITSLDWSQPDKLHFIARQAPPYTKLSVYEARIKSKQYGSYFGWDGEAISLHRARDSVIARVTNHDHEAVHALGVESQSWPFPSFYKSEYEIASSDAFRNPGSNDFTLVLARSSPQGAVWLVTCKAGGYGLVKLSSHNSSFDGFRSKRISATGPDKWECDAWLFSPMPVTITRRLPPTVVLLQSHPTLPSFSMGPHLDVAHLTAAGYVVPCPNLRRTTGGIGERYTDVLAILRKGVSENLADESRVTLSGWSDGGFLSSLAVIRDDFSFRAVVCGGGSVDWDFVNANSDPFWPSPDIPSLSGDGKRSPVWKRQAEKKRKTPLLILHRREDDEVPVSGPLAFWREKHRWNGPVQMVLYPKEKHIIQDRRHLIDLWTRVLEFYDRHLV
ncbi:Alpha/Beta hydrolase protein [Aspergillus venezuelensis]